MRKTALITGGGSGMGEATSLRLAKEGHAVGVLDINLAAAQMVVSRIVASGGEAIAIQADITDRKEVALALASLGDAFGPTTILINNAGIADFKPILDITDVNWDRIHNVNTKGVLIVTQAVLPDMIAQGWGRIVNIASLAGSHGAPRMAHYSASKAGVIGLTKSLALELGGNGITVNVVAPGLIDTPMSTKSAENGDFSGLSLEEIAQMQPIKRMGTAEEIAEACAYFTSDLAGYTTGQLIGVNGGTAM